MKQKNLAKTIALSTASAALILAMGVGVMASNDKTGTVLKGNGTDIMEILTDEQKAELQQSQKEDLAEALKDGVITQEQYDDAIEKIQNGEMPRMMVGFHGGRNGKGPEQFEQHLEDVQAKWDALTDAQKKQLQDLADEKLALELKTIDKQVELGLLEQEAADVIKQDLTSRHEEEKANGSVGFGRRGVFHAAVEMP